MSLLDIRQWNYPTRIVIGAGAIARLPDLCAAHGMSRVLFVTDKGLAEAPILKKAVDAVPKGKLKAEVFSDVKGNPTESNVNSGLEVFRKGKFDGVVAFGGGSGLDAGKAIAFMAAQDRPLWDFEDVGDNWKRGKTEGLAPVIAVPTTAGTGSEVGRASVIGNEKTKDKKIIFHPAMMPKVALCDPELTVGLPPHLTAATGFDAFTHCLEAFCAPGYHPMAEGVAMTGMRLCSQHLLDAIRDGRNVEARTHMMTAAIAGATAFQKGLGGVHALSHGIGAIYDSHHGLTNAVMLPYVLKANQEAVWDQMLRIGRLLGLGDGGFEPVFDWMLKFREMAGIPHAATALGCEESKAKEMGERAVKDPTAGGNPIPFDASEYSEIYLKACRGTL
ncbi:MAG: iron-containing alcohol dehydrogenase [Pseudomonadota bacterium]|nr:iron-containing alcohol dehydrogenase [Pseudomonadota bacterium]